MKKLLVSAIVFAVGLSCAFANPDELQKACDGGDWEKCVELGLKYYRGEDGLTADHWKAHSYFEKSCKEGKSPEGCYRDGVFHLVGFGAEHNLTWSKLHLKMACDNGHADACKMYERALEQDKMEHE